MLLNIKENSDIYYKEKKIINCPNCNNTIFFINNSIDHKCLMKENETFNINEPKIKAENNEFLCDVNKIEFKCKKHNKEFTYYRDSNYYCNKCFQESKLTNFITLNSIILSDKEIEKFQELIENCEKIMNDIEENHNKLLKELNESYENFKERNNSLIKFCKNLIKFNENYKNNFNLISTIRRISKNVDINKFKNKNTNEIIDFYDDQNIITFNNNFDSYFDSYFNSDIIIKNGKYYLGNLINENESFCQVFKALSIKDKKLVAVKKIPLNNEEIKKRCLNEVEILKEMNKNDYGIKYIKSFEEKNNDNNNFYIITELYDNNLRKEINNYKNYKNGFNFEYIKKIFCQINDELKYLKKINKLSYLDFKPENILIQKIENKDKTFFYKYKLCDFFKNQKKSDGIYSNSSFPEEKNFFIFNYHDKSILFNIGILLYELYYGNEQTKANKNKIKNDIQNGLKIKNENDDFDDFNNLKNLIEECTKEEEKRIKWDDYFNHPFFNYEIEIILDIKEDDLKTKTKFINLDLFNDKNTELFIDNKKELFCKEYKFNKSGNHIIKLIFNSNIIQSTLEKLFFDCKNIKFIKFKIFNTSNVENMNSMFAKCTNLKEIDLNFINTTNVKDMNSMFSECKSLEKIYLTSFNTSNVKNMNDMFFGCCKLNKINLSSSFNTSNVKNMNNMFEYCHKLKEIDLSTFNTIKVENMENMFYGCHKLNKINLSSFDTSNVKNMHGMFCGCIKVKEIDLSTFNTIKVENMDHMFGVCAKLNKINLSSFDTSNVKNMNGMFSSCYKLKQIDLNSFNIENVENMGSIFRECFNLTDVKLSSFTTSKVKDMRFMFFNCYNLKEIDLSSFNTENVEFMGNMFRGCSNLNKINLSSFNTSNCKNITLMFSDCCNLEEIDLLSFDFSNIKDTNMFSGCSKIKIKIKEEFKEKFDMNNNNIIFEFK